MPWKVACRRPSLFALAISLFGGVLLSILGCSPQGAKPQRTLLNVSYDPTRELYAAVNAAFVRDWEKQHGERVVIRVSHGGSGKQARAVIDGLKADVVTLALAYDIDAITQKTQQVAADWQKRLPNDSCPYLSTIVFLVRKGNPKGIKTWEDLTKEGVGIITPNPQTSGGARWNYLAAWGYVVRRELGDFKKLTDPSKADEAAAANRKAQALVQAIFKNVLKLDSGARAATNTFVMNKLGDVLLAWENEALATVAQLPQELEMVAPPVSIRAEPPVAVVDAVVDARGTRDLAEAYLKFLYTPEAQRLVAENGYRPSLAAEAERHKDRFAEIALFSIDEAFGGWKRAQREHFDDGGLFDQMQKAIRKQ